MNGNRIRLSNAISVLLIGLAIFGFFHLATTLISDASGGAMDEGRAPLLFRAAIAVVLSTVIVGAHRRRMITSPAQAFSLGLQLAIVIAVVDHLLTPQADQSRALLRTTTVIIGLPLLLALSSVIDSRLYRDSARATE